MKKFTPDRDLTEAEMVKKYTSGENKIGEGESVETYLKKRWAYINGTATWKEVMEAHGNATFRKARLRIIVGILILFSNVCMAQPFVEMGFTNNGVHGGAGYVSPQGIGINAAFYVPITKTTVPNTVTAGALYQVNISHKEKDNFTATATLGIAFNNYTDAGKYLGYTNTIGGAYGLELGKDWYMGRLFISGNYMSRWYVGAGMKIFFK